MQIEKLDKIGDELAQSISSKTAKAMSMEEKDESVLIPTAEFSEIAKARNEQAKQDNERVRWEYDKYKADLEAETRKAELELERLKLAQTMELERLRLENEIKVAQTRADADKESATIEQEATDTRSKRDLIGKILDFLGRVLVAVLGLGAAIYQANTILRQEEKDEFVNTKSMSFWHRPKSS